MVRLAECRAVRVNSPITPSSYLTGARGHSKGKRTNMAKVKKSGGAGKRNKTKAAKAAKASAVPKVKTTKKVAVKAHPRKGTKGVKKHAKMITTLKPKPGRHKGFTGVLGGAEHKAFFDKKIAPHMGKLGKHPNAFENHVNFMARHAKPAA